MSDEIEALAKRVDWAADFIRKHGWPGEFEDIEKAAAALRSLSRRVEELDREFDALFAERTRLRLALFSLYNMTAVMKFEPAPGQPHPLKDGAYDRVMREINEALQAFDPPAAGAE